MTKNKISEVIEYRKVTVGAENVDAICITLLSKNFILLRGNKGYVACGYLDMKVADKFKDVAVKITGVSTINEALKAKAAVVSAAAKRIGLHKGEAVRDILKKIS